MLVNQYSFTNTRFRLFFFVNEQYENTSSFVFRWEYGFSFVKYPFTPTMCYYGSLTLRLIGAKMDRNWRKLETDSHFESRSTDNTKKQNNHNKELKRLSRITRSHISTLFSNALLKLPGLATCNKPVGKEFQSFLYLSKRVW